MTAEFINDADGYHQKASRRSILRRAAVGAAGITALGVARPAAVAEAATTGPGPSDWINVTESPYNADPTGTLDSASAIQSAINAVSSGGGVVYLPAGTYMVSTTLTCTTQGLYIRGAGRWATVVKFTGTGDCIRIYNSTYGGNQPTGDGGGVLGLTIDGASAGAGSTGLHAGDQTAFDFDVAVRRFSGAGSIGVHLDNTIWWTEEMNARFWVYNCTSGVVFDVSGATTSTNSFGYNHIDVYVNCYPNQNGVVVQNGAYLYNSRLRLRGNFQGASSAVTNATLTITGTVPSGHPDAGSYSRIYGCDLDIQVEVTGTYAFTPHTITFGSAANQLTGSGTIRFADGFTPSGTVLGTGAQVLIFDGWFQGDPNLNAADTTVGPVEFPAFTQITTGLPSGWGGHIRYRRLGTMQVEMDWALSIASGTALTPGIKITTMPSGYYYSDTKMLPGDLKSTAHFYAPLAITSAGSVTYEGPSQTLSTTGYLYGQGRFNIAV